MLSQLTDIVPEDRTVGNRIVEERSSGPTCLRRRKLVHIVGSEFLLTLDIKSHGVRATTSPSRQVDGSACALRKLGNFRPVLARVCI